MHDGNYDMDDRRTVLRLSTQGDGNHGLDGSERYVTVADDTDDG